MPRLDLPVRINRRPQSLRTPSPCTTPKITLPARVPHRLTRPPMITASKPKISRPGPKKGSKFDRIARNTPAIATIPRHSAIARA